MKWRAKQKGFTIVELLIVIIVIGILAAITVVAYGTIKVRASNTTVETNLVVVSKHFEMFRVDNGRYPSSLADNAAVKSNGLKIKGTMANTMLYCVDTANPTSYLLLANAYPTGTTFKWTAGGQLDKNSGVVIGSGTTTCQAQMGGVATVTGSWAGDFAMVQ